MAVDELIEYLRGVAENANLPKYMRDRLTEAAAALEAAREDAGRYRWLRDRMTAEELADEAHAMLALRVVGPIAKRPADPEYFDELDAAIDQARGKAGQEVGK
jgi:hypothetical protein